jgi:hypothetical protein
MERTAKMEKEIQIFNLHCIAVLEELRDALIDLNKVIGEK